MAKFGLSQSVRRVEDPRLLTGRGRYTDDISMPGQAHGIVLRQAMNEVERAMLTLPGEARQGAPWQTAVQQVSKAMATLREGGDPAAARAAAGEALGTLPALRGEETGSSGG